MLLYFTHQVQCSGNDDDGEHGAGSRMAEMMHLMGVNNVFVMVSRCAFLRAMNSYNIA